jgi:hypothetical protein
MFENGLLGDKNQHSAPFPEARRMVWPRRSSLVYSKRQVLENDSYNVSACRHGVRWQATRDTALERGTVPKILYDLKRDAIHQNDAVAALCHHPSAVVLTKEELHDALRVGEVGRFIGNYTGGGSPNPTFECPHSGCLALFQAQSVCSKGPRFQWRKCQSGSFVKPSRPHSRR